MTQVSEQEFREFVQRHNAVPDGFRINGEYCQTRFKAGNQEVGRVSLSGTARVHEIDETIDTRSHNERN